MGFTDIIQCIKHQNGDNMYWFSHLIILQCIDNMFLEVFHFGAYACRNDITNLNDVFANEEFSIPEVRELSSVPCVMILEHLWREMNFHIGTSLKSITLFLIYPLPIHYTGFKLIHVQVQNLLFHQVNPIQLSCFSMKPDIKEI